MSHIKRYFLTFCMGAMSYFGIAGMTQAQVTLELVNPGSNISNNVYVGPYTLSINGTGTIQAVCDDRDTEIKGSTWTADLNTFSTLVNTKFYGLSSINTNSQQQNYEAAGWLVQQMFALGPKDPANYATVADIHLAIWSFFSSTANTSLASNPGAQTWYSSALVHDNDLASNPSEFSDIIIYTPNPKSDSQEMMMVTPEPASMMLFGTGLLAIGAAIRRRSHRKASV